MQSMHFYVKIDDREMSYQILERLERDFRLKSTQNNIAYYQLISYIEIYVNASSFKMKYGLK